MNLNIFIIAAHNSTNPGTMCCIASPPILKEKFMAMTLCVFKPAATETHYLLLTGKHSTPKTRARKLIWEYHVIL